MQEELVSEQNRTTHLQQRLDLSEKNRDAASADRDEWELKSDHYKKKADTYAAQIADLETKLRGYKRANDSANDAANYYKDQVDRHLADLNSQVETNRLQTEADKAEIEKNKAEIGKLKTEIEKLKAENAALTAEAMRPSRSNKAPGLFENPPSTAAPAGSKGTGGAVNTSPEKLAAIIDKQSFDMVEMKKKLAAAEEHVTSLRREMQQVRTPETPQFDEFPPNKSHRHRPILGMVTCWPATTALPGAPCCDPRLPTALLLGFALVGRTKDPAESASGGDGQESLPINPDVRMASHILVIYYFTVIYCKFVGTQMKLVNTFTCHLKM